MKIALIIDRFLPAKGGGERYVEILARGLAERGHDITIFSRRFPEGHPPENIHYHPVRTLTWPGFLKVLSFARRCGAEIAMGDFDIAHDVGHIVGADVFNPHGGVEQVWLKRYFASYENPFHRAFKRIQRRLSPKEWTMIALQRRQYLSFDTRRILAISPMIRDHIRSHYPGIPARKIVLVQNPANLSRFSPGNRAQFRDATRERLHLSDGEIVLLFASNNFRLKGLHPLLRSLKILRGLNESARPFRLLVAGNEDAARWKRLAKRLGVTNLVTFLGPVKEMEHLYAAADIFVLPTFFDSASLVVLEALASGLPVITSRWAGASALIDAPATGMVLRNNDDPVEIAKAVAAYFPDKPRERALSASPRQVGAIVLDRHIERVLGIYEEILKEKSHG